MTEYIRKKAIILIREKTGADFFCHQIEAAIDDAISHGKTLRFTHDPRLWGKSALGNEWVYMNMEHDYEKLILKEGYWYAEK